jgi:hypothetical protein
MNKQPPPRPFLDWYAEQFDVGAVNDSNYRECASYLEGLRDAMTPQLSEEAVQRLMRCESVLRAAGNMIQHARRMGCVVYDPN